MLSERGLRDELDVEPVGPGGPQVPGWSRRRSLATALAVLAVVGLGLIAWGFGRGGAPTVTVSDRGGDVAAPRVESVPGLHVTLSGPTALRVGQPASFRVTYTDDDGSFIGSAQDWGDAGEGSAKQGACAGTSAPSPLHGSLVATHRWSAPGTYEVSITVTTSTCEAGQARTEDAGARTTVTVRR